MVATLEKTRVMVVDDEVDLLDNLKEWLTSSGYETMAARDGREAIAMARQTPVEVVITDLRMPSINGHDLAALLKDLDPRIEIIFLTGQGTMEDAILALREGKVFDFLQKPLKDLRQLNVIIEKALVRRHRTATPDRPEAGPAVIAGRMPAFDLLNVREREILALLIKGFDNRSIAERIALSEKTVRNHLSVIYEKLGVSNRTQAALRARDFWLS
ncbi:MAG: response regulator transcription factor [Candidatus Sericytochromatia bacterium]|nr:response regulator transcription factor [Candidatus Sericytochromatia bacterium]